MNRFEHTPASTQLPLPTTRRRWLALAGVCLSLVLMAGCQQFVILSYLIGGPPSIEPDFDKETGICLKDKKKTVAVVCLGIVPK